MLNKGDDFLLKCTNNAWYMVSPNVFFFNSLNMINSLLKYICLNINTNILTLVSHSFSVTSRCVGRRPCENYRKIEDSHKEGENFK